MRCLSLCLLFIMLFAAGCAKQPAVETVYVYKTMHCEDAVKPELQPLDANQYFSSKANVAKLLSNFAALNLYVDRLQQQIECYKSQFLEDDCSSKETQATDKETK